MSYRLVKLVLATDLPPTERLVLIVLAEQANHAGRECWRHGVGGVAAGWRFSLRQCAAGARPHERHRPAWACARAGLAGGGECVAGGEGEAWGAGVSRLRLRRRASMDIERLGPPGFQ